MLESKVQAKLIKKLEAQGCYVVKLVKTNKNGIADLLVLSKDKEPYFIEVKAKKGRVSELQKYRAEEIEKKTGIKTIFYFEP